MNANSKNHVLVIGGSISGLLSARILAEHFEKVTIIERDKLPENPQARQGVPQSIQPHILLARGYRILEELFPSLGTELTEKGALKIDWAREFQILSQAGWGATSESPSEIISFSCSRPLLEWVIRNQLIEQFPKVRFLEQTKVNGLHYDSEKKQVMGVSASSLDNSSSEEILEADLVVDASGYNSQACQWLQNLGLTPPPETVINPLIGSATRRYRLSPDIQQPNWKVIVIREFPPAKTKFGFLAQIEGEELIVSLGEYGQEFTSTEDETFLEFARSLPSPRLSEILRQAVPVSPIVVNSPHANRLRHYEQIELPAGFIAIGDSVCSLSPVYGLGITISTLGIMVLRKWLAESSEKGLSVNDFQQSLAKTNSPHWSFTTFLDARFPTTVTQSNSQVKRPQKKSKPGKIAQFLTWYSWQFTVRTTLDPRFYKLWLEGVHLLKSPLAFYNPLVMLKVLYTGLTEKRAIPS